MRIVSDRFQTVRPDTIPLVIGVALRDSAGPDAVTAVTRLDQAGVGFVAIDDSFEPGPDRLDALLLAARLAPATTRIGLLATVTVTHTEPFHISKNVATLDWVSDGRGGWIVDVSTTRAEADLFGRTSPAPIEQLAREAADAVDVVRRLWDSWEDDAVIRDVATGRFVDRDKLHYVDFEGEFFSVRGPSITPRPPQGQPLVAIDTSVTDFASLAVRHADLAIVRSGSVGEVAIEVAALRRAAADAGRGDELRVVARVVDPIRTAHEAAALVARVAALESEAGVDAVLLEEVTDTDSVERLASDVLPAFHDNGGVGTTLRDRFGLARPANRYARGTA